MLKVLVIDADSNFASVLGREIVKEGHEARIVGDAKYGIVRARAFEPDLVLMDTNIPGVVGTRLIEDLKSFVPGRIVICTDSNDPADVKAAIAAGASDYVLKNSGVEAIISRTCKSDDAGDAGDDAGDSDGGGQEEGSGSSSQKTGPMQMLRAPIKEGKRPFCVVVAHTDPDKRSFITEIVDRLNRLIEDLKSFVPGRIVICTDSNDPADVKAAIAAGASDYVLKNSGVEAIISRTCKSDDAGDAGDDAGDSDGGGQEEGSGSSSQKTGPMQMLRAPIKEGKRPFCVVVAHTDPDKRSFITEIVERLNRAVRVIEVSSSMDAITTCAANRTVMLIIDWEMPDIAARQVMRTVHGSKHGKTVAMFVTYKGHSPEKQRVAMYAGAMAFVGEPWDNGSLEAQLKQAFNVIRKRRRTAMIKAQQTKVA